VAVIDRQHEHTVRLEAQALERRAESADDVQSATLLALLAISRRLELLRAALDA
jgi:hypothetical protein